MKKIIFTIFILSLWNYSFSQCTVTNIAVELKSSIEVNGHCQVVFNFSWDQEVNHGNKYAYVHLWRSDQYPDLNGSGNAYSESSDFPTATDLANALATIVIEENGGPSPYIGYQYPDSEVPVLINGISVKKRTDLSRTRKDDTQ